MKTSRCDGDSQARPSRETPTARRRSAIEHALPAHSLAIPTVAGTFHATFSNVGLCALSFPQPGPPSSQELNLDNLPEDVRGWAAATASALDSILAGEEPRHWPALDLSAGTPFQQRVWQALRAIPRGETRTYGALADSIGHPRAARAIGQACGANPVPVLVPCHRVLAAEGRLGGFSGGLEWKRQLLERERQNVV